MPRPPVSRRPRPPQNSRPGPRLRGAPPSQPLREDFDPPRERKLYGVNACRAFFHHRASRLIRAWFSEETARRYFGEAMRYCAAHRLAYHVVPEEELERVTASRHHEGVCFLVEEEPPLELEGFLDGLRPGVPACLLVLDGVGNPHNLGAMMRSAAHFGARAILMSGAVALSSGATVRTAEGGAEQVLAVEAGNLSLALARLKRAGFTILSTSSHGGRNLYQTALPPRTAILLGEEGEGLSPSTMAAGDLKVCIPGTGSVESLNVSVALGVLLGEYWRQHHRG